MKNFLVMILVLLFSLSLNAAEEEAQRNTIPEQMIRLHEIPLVADQKINTQYYRVGAGDLFQLNLNVEEPQYFSLMVSPSGDLLIPAVGMLNLTGKTLVDARQQIQDLCQSQYAGAVVHVTLQQTRRIPVRVHPENATPLVVQVAPQTPVEYVYLAFLQAMTDREEMLNEEADSTDTNEEFIRQLYRRNDIDQPVKRHFPVYPQYMNDIYSYRHLQLLHADGHVTAVDLVQCRDQEPGKFVPYFSEGDILQIPLLTEEISIQGGVVLPGSYEYHSGLTLQQALLDAGGLQPGALKDSLRIFGFNTDGLPQVITGSLQQLKSRLLQPDDRVQILIPREHHRYRTVQVEGEVKFPGEYPLLPNHKDVAALLALAGGLTTLADPDKLIIVRNQEDYELTRLVNEQILVTDDTEKSYQRSRMQAASGFSYYTGSEQMEEAQKRLLIHGDRLIIPVLNDFVEVIGAVQNPGRYPRVPGTGWRDYIQLAGGLRENAAQKFWIVHPETGVKVKAGSRPLIAGDVLFVEEKYHYRKWDRFKDMVAVTSSVLTSVVLVVTLSR